MLALAATGFFDAESFADGLPALMQLGSEMVPPNFARWQSWLKPLLDTLAMSVAGTALTVIVSLPLALLASPNTTPQRRSEMGRAGPRKVSVLFDCWSFGLARSRILSARSGGKAWSRTPIPNGSA